MNDDLKLSPELNLIAAHWPTQVVDNYIPYAATWRDQYAGEAACTRARHLVAIRDFAQLANGRNLDPRLILEFNAYLRATKRNGTTMNRCTQSVRSFLGWLKSVGVITMDPSMALASYVSTPPRVMRIFTHEEYMKIVAYGESHPERFAVATWLVVLSYHTGMSLVDCCHLLWSEVHIDPGGPCYIQHIRIKVGRFMGRKALCTIPIIVGSELWNWLSRLAKAYKDKSDFVHPEAATFYSNKAKEPKRVIRYLLYHSLGRDGKYRRTFRCLRNTFCSRMLNAGVDPITVAKMTGHSRLDQLSAYATPDIRAMQEAVKKGMDYVTRTHEATAIQLDSLPGASAGQ